jgi:hypothetical protein
MAEMKIAASIYSISRKYACIANKKHARSNYSSSSERVCLFTFLKNFIGNESIKVQQEMKASCVCFHKFRHFSYDCETW